MIYDRLDIVNEEFYTDAVDAATYDLLLADAWRHFGTLFFRYNFGVYVGEIRRVIPLRVRLENFQLSKSQRRVLRRNGDLDCVIKAIRITAEIEDLFHRHKQRFRTGTPTSVYDFIDRDAVRIPTDGFQLTARSNGGLVAVTFFDLAATSISAIYACFDPEEKRRSLGIFTMLKVIEHAAILGLEFYYHGYAYEGESFYDYKKKFSGLERFDWRDWSGEHPARPMNCLQL